MNPDRARRRWLRRRAAWLLDAYVAVTPTLARVALADGESSAERLHVVLNGVDTTRFAADAEARRTIRRSLGIAEDAWVVGTVGRLAPEKDQALLVRAMIPMLDERRQLIIVGDGPERGQLAELAASSLRSQFCHQVGAQSDVERWLAAFDVFVLSSSTEGLPIGLLEAMATGVPVLSTAVGGVPDLIENGVSGILVAQGDEPDLRRQLIFLANHPTAALRLASAGRERVVARHSLTQMAERYRAIYEQVCSAGPQAHAGEEPTKLHAERRGMLRVVNQ